MFSAYRSRHLRHIPVSSIAVALTLGEKVSVELHTKGPLRDFWLSETCRPQALEGRTIVAA